MVNVISEGIVTAPITNQGERDLIRETETWAMYRGLRAGLSVLEACHEPFGDVGIANNVARCWGAVVFGPGEKHPKLPKAYKTPFNGSDVPEDMRLYKPSSTVALAVAAGAKGSTTGDQPSAEGRESLAVLRAHPAFPGSPDCEWNAPLPENREYTYTDKGGSITRKFPAGCVPSKLSEKGQACYLYWVKIQFPRHLTGQDRSKWRAVASRVLGSSGAVQTNGKSDRTVVMS